MTPEEVKRYYKSSYTFNKKTGMSHSSLNNWLKWGFVPTESQLKIEKLTQGALKASLEVKGMDELMVKWPKVVSEEPLIKWIDLCNGTMFRIISFFTNKPKYGLFVAIERVGCFIFSKENFKSGTYVSEKLNLSLVDACVIADWINAQLDIKDSIQQGAYYLNYYDKVEPYCLGGEQMQMPLVPHIFSE